MKFPFFKSLLVTGALLLAWNCTDSTTVSPGDFISDNAAEFYVIDSPEKGTLYIAEDGTVTNAQGEVVGQYADGQITDVDGSIMMEASLEDLDKVKLIETEDGQTLVVSSDGKVTDKSGNDIGSVDSNGNIVNNNGEVIVSNNNQSSNENGSGGQNQENGSSEQQNQNQNTATSSASNGSSTNSGNENQQQIISSTSTEPIVTHQTIGSVTIDGALIQTVEKNAQISTITVSGINGEQDITRLSWNLYWLDLKFSNGTYTISGTVPEYFQDGEFTETFQFSGNVVEIKLSVGAGSSNQNQNQTTSSSSKQQTSVSSSSKVTASSSSVAVITTGCPSITYVSGGQSGSGFASRYWDGCKPSCSWKENTNNLAKQCSANGKTQLTDYSARSVCDGGTAATCTSHIPFTKDGCTNIGFAFAAVPSNSPACGRCFELTFTGEGKYESKKNHRNLKGKKLIVMASNIGGDVSGGQFDILIPGGGWGIYNGLSGYGWGSQGKQYGGLLSECEESAGYSGSDDEIYTKRKECLINKCNSVFSSDSEAKQGCLFLANFMEAAGNPLHNYKEVNCPAELSSRYNN